MSDLPPTTPGVGTWIFSGIRYTNRRGGLVTVNAVCEVRQMVWPRHELAVFFIGRDTPYPLQNFSGTWRNIDDLLGKATQ